MKKKHLSDNELTLLMEQLRMARNDAKSLVDKPTALLLETMLRTGIRTDELMSIKLSEIDDLNGVIHVHRPAKGSHPRYCHVPRELIQAIRDTATSQQLMPDELLSKLIPWNGKPTLGGRRALQRRWERLRLDLYGRSFTLGLHALRHTAAYAVLNAKGSNISILQAFLGHKSLNTTAIYVATFSHEEVNSVVQSTFLGKMD